MLREVAVRGAVGLFALAAVIPSSANGAMLDLGFYALHNHPSAALDPPPYGMRLDGLDGNPANEYTFDFDHVTSAMWLTLTEPSPGVYTIRIEGKTWGGQDIGTGYANDAYLGLYEVVFEYTMNGTDAPGDDDIQVNPDNPGNAGYVKDPQGVTHYMKDFKGAQDFSFRFGDETDDQGHLGVPGISGWGWLRHGLVEGQEFTIGSSDWVFMAVKSDIPAPGAMALAGIGLLVSGTGRRRR